MNSQTTRAASPKAGFTLIELLLSTVVIAGLMYFLINTVDQTQKVWVRTTEKIVEFQSARSAFESMTRRLSQATLNTYWRAHDTDITNAVAAYKFRRQSELQFISGPTKRFFGASPEPTNLSKPLDKAYPTHAVFFQAPIGYTEEAPTTGAKLPYYRSLDSLLATCGYFIEYGVEPDRPGFIDSLNPKMPDRYRHRLMEMTIPSERLTIFQRYKVGGAADDLGSTDPRVFDEKIAYYAGMVNTNRNPNSSWTRPLWMKEAFVRETIGSTGGKSRFKFAHVRAENIIALVILPKLAEKDRVVPGSTSYDPTQLELAPSYEFDSWRILSGGTASDNSTGTVRSLDNTARDNLLPPIVQITMVAVDEKAIARFGPDASRIPDWTNGLFAQAKVVKDYTTDMQTLEQRLIDDPYKPNYRIFTADIVLRGSKWSRDPKP